MITTVTLNPAIDKSIILDEVLLGQVNRIIEEVECVGGKGINVSKIINLFGEKTTATGILGEQNSAYFKKYLSGIGITYDFVEVDGKTRTNIKVNELKSQRTTDLNEQGVFVDENKQEEFAVELIKLAKKSKYVVLSGSLPKGIEEDFYSKLIQSIKNHTNVVLDTAGERLKKGIECGADMIKPNKEEIEQTYGVLFENNEQCVEFCKELIAKNQLSTILLTLGGDGAVYISKDNVLYGLPVKVTAINTVGAGDSFLGGFLSAKAQGQNDEDAFKRAIACGALAVMQKGTDVFEISEFDKMIERVELKK